MMARKGALRCFIAAVLFGASTPAASRLAGDMPTLVLAGLLYVGAAIAVSPPTLRRPRPLRQLRRGGRRLAVAVLFGGAIGPALLVAGLVRVPAATASLLLNFELVATTVVAAVVFHENLGRRMLAAVALVVGAGVLLVWQPGVGFELGGLLVIGACVAWGVDNSATAHIDQLAPEQITFAKGAVAGTANLLLGLLLFGAGGITPARVAAALAVGAVGYGLSITLWVKGARDLGAARGQVIFAFAPFVGAVISWTLLAEPASTVQIVALAIASAGVALSLQTTHSHRHRHQALEHEHEHSHDDAHHDHPHTPPVTGRHTHRHTHERLDHEHPHYPDIHHGHSH
jgi:drug/metabolite transporter (DMT)-like permease